jgi:hypothetical protein
MRLSLVAAATVSSLAGTMPTISEAFVGARNTTINPVNGAVFEVVARGASDGTAYWCGAADYARRALGASWRARVHIVRGRGPSLTTNFRTAVHFTIDPKAAGVKSANPSVSLNNLVAGDSMSVQQANAYCKVLPIRD